MSPTTAEALQALADIESSLSGERECLEEFDLVRAFIESAGADSERYRWLRDGCDDKLSEATRIAANCYGIEWDAAIDQARAAILAARSTTAGEG